jgi:flagellin
LQKTLFRLSSGSRINSGADDAAGLAIADGLRANVTALTQSARNATDGVGQLQVADGALAQVTTLLNRAVTLATEASTSTVSQGQRDSIQAEYAQIKAEINRIGTSTTFNGVAVFQGAGSTSDTNTWQSSAGNAAAGGISGSTGIADGETFSITDTNTGKTFTYTGAGGAGSVSGLVTAIQTAASDPSGANYVNVTAAVDSTGHLSIKDANGDHSIIVTTTAANLGGSGMEAGTMAVGGTQAVLLSDGGVNSTLTTTIGALSASGLNLSGSLAGSDGSGATTELGRVNSAIQQIASQRGTIGAGINRLQSAQSVMNNQIQNLSAAEDGIRSADIAQEVANMTKYNILNQTGISALSQSNQMQQGVLSLLR